jgi:hypothetical protein
MEPRLIYSLSTGRFAGGSFRKNDSEYFAAIGTNFRGNCLKLKTSPIPLARTSVVPSRPNSRGKIPNILYVDFVEVARRRRRDRHERALLITQPAAATS